MAFCSFFLSTGKYQEIPVFGNRTCATDTIERNSFEKCWNIPLTVKHRVIKQLANILVTVWQVSQVSRYANARLRWSIHTNKDIQQSFSTSLEQVLHVNMATSQSSKYQAILVGLNILWHSNTKITKVRHPDRQRLKYQHTPWLYLKLSASDWL